MSSGLWDVEGSWVLCFGWLRRMDALGFGAVGSQEFHCAHPSAEKEWRMVLKFLYRIGVIRELLSQK